ncbi:MAG TPA: ArsA-related P-loop ATPase [Kofleriaceae bacterium]
MTLESALDRYRLLICIGTGGVGKTTVAAAIAYAAAQRGRRALVLTIDPARALARALGLTSLGAEQRVAAPVTGVLAAAMLDQKRAWDSFVTRHAPTPAIAAALLGNALYQRLSTSFAGSTEYMAIEETCRLSESGDYDLIVLDTPPAAHALDFVNAPERIDRFLAPEVASWFASPYQALGRTAWRSAGFTARFLLARLEHAAGRSTLRDISEFFVALDTLIDGVIARTRRARQLLRGGDAAFVLVTAPRQLVIDETRALAAKLVAQPTPLAGVIVNRVHPLPAVDPLVAERELATLGEDASARWLQRAWRDVLAEARDERAVIERFAAMIPPSVPLAELAEADHDLHSLLDIAAIAGALYKPSTATTTPVTAISPPAALSP